MPQNRLILKFSNLSVLHEGPLMQDWVFRLGYLLKKFCWHLSKPIPFMPIFWLSFVHNRMFSTTSIDRTGEKMTVFMSIEIKFTKVGHIVNVICILEVLHFYFASISVFHSTFRSVVKQCIKLYIPRAIKTQINLEPFCSWADWTAILLNYPTFDFFSEV